ncbi:MAG TPA: hypothetical protein VGG29_03535 [Caulobacteraceae bacterium]|jgi:hypothetical protein
MKLAIAAVFAAALLGCALLLVSVAPPTGAGAAAAGRPWSP